MRTGGKFFNDMADNSDGTHTVYIVSKHPRDLIGKLKCRGRKLKATTLKKPKHAAGEKPKLATPKRTYRDIFA